MQQSLTGIVYFIAFSHALMLTILLFKQSGFSRPGKWLALISLVITYQLYEGGAMYSGLYQYVAHSMDLMPGAVLYVGPMLWLYVCQIKGNKRSPWYRLVLHFLPAIALWLYNSPSVFNALENKIAMWDFIVSNSNHALPPMIIALLLSIKVHLGCYLFFSWRAIQPLKAASTQLKADSSQTTLSQIQFLAIAFFLLEVVWVCLFVAQQFFDIGTLAMVSDTWLLFIAVILLSIGFIGLQQPELVFTPEECKLAEQQTSAESSSADNIKYLHSALPESTSEVLAKELEQQIQSQQLYLNEKLTLTDLAKATEIKAHTLSQVINQSMKTNFYKLINGYRVQHATALIEDKHNDWSLERIAYESGFNNRVTFSKAFKETMDCTPSQYRNEQKARANG